VDISSLRALHDF